MRVESIHVAQNYQRAGVGELHTLEAVGPVLVWGRGRGGSYEQSNKGTTNTTLALRGQTHPIL